MNYMFCILEIVYSVPTKGRASHTTITSNSPLVGDGRFNPAGRFNPDGRFNRDGCFNPQLHETSDP